MPQLCNPHDTRMEPATKSLRSPDSFRRAAEAFGLDFEGGDLERLGSYLAMLLEANTCFNLTAITDPDGAWIKHIFDSLTLLPYIASAQATRVIDVGSGGGLPGVPLAIAIPAVQFTLLEATGKKADFLGDVAGTLGLPNVEVINDRAETLGHDPHHREHYDVVVARAVGRLATLLELTVPLAGVGGHVLTIKGRKATQEISDAKQALHRLHCAVVETSRTPTGTIVVIKKLRRTPNRYPRRPGEPKRSPLGFVPPRHNL
ncbi:MAG: 16S rRNA (guanine(527)-N(7))-methyltransferase RsmG [Planctomycetes bacterium]|nr:16S rRNA (guanine(527)-N(7))-methyltransferase RsmG [Planctomycetota bacterium]